MIIRIIDRLEFEEYDDPCDHCRHRKRFKDTDFPCNQCIHNTNHLEYSKEDFRR